MTQKPKRQRSIRLPDDVWDWLDDQPGGAGRTVEALARPAMRRAGGIEARVTALEEIVARLAEQSASRLG